MGNDVFGNVVEFGKVEHGAGIAHGAGLEREVLIRRGRICLPPLLVVGVEQRHKIFDDACSRVSFFKIEAERAFRVLALGHFALGAGLFVKLHDLRRVAEARHLEAAGAPQFHVPRQGGEPFFAADNIGGAHEMVVYHVGKVIGRNAVRF